MNDLLAPIAQYYTDKLRSYGNDPRGVDWNGSEGQMLRFVQLCKVLDRDTSFSLSDIGCGYGALLDFLNLHFSGFDYTGVDISQAMVDAATQRFAGNENIRFVQGTQAPQSTDFAIASGIFNVKLGQSEDAWRAYIRATLDSMHGCTTKGFAFNCLTSYSDAEKMRPDLHYADPCELFDLCKRQFSRNVALLHDYGLYEFTILVRK